MAMGKPKGEWADREDYCAWLAFGRTDETARAGEGDFRRLPIGKISNQDNEVARAARLAPSGLNNQPWRLEFRENGVSVTHVPRGPMKLVTKKKVDKISLGIVACHIEIAYAHQGRLVDSVTPSTEGKGFAIEVKLA
jgi:hypothetical protein